MIFAQKNVLQNFQKPHVFSLPDRKSIIKARTRKHVREISKNDRSMTTSKKILLIPVVFPGFMLLFVLSIIFLPNLMFYYLEDEYSFIFQ